MQEFTGKVAVVTGGGSGIGRAMAITFAREGMRVAIADMREDAARAVAETVKSDGGEAAAWGVDVTDREAVAALAAGVYERFGAVHLLCNNAGVVARTPLLEPEIGEWRWIVDVNLFGVVNVLQAFLPRMVAGSEEGHVVNTASVAGLWAPIVTPDARGGGVPSIAATGYGYTASKYAVVGVTEALAAELASTKIGVSVLCPNRHDTDIFHNSVTGRPQAAGGPGDSPGRFKEMIAGGTLSMEGRRTAFEAAQRVLRGVRRGDLFIITHPEDRPQVEARAARVLAGYDSAAAFEGGARPAAT